MPSRFGFPSDVRAGVDALSCAAVESGASATVASSANPLARKAISHHVSSSGPQRMHGNPVCQDIATSDRAASRCCAMLESEKRSGKKTMIDQHTGAVLFTINLGQLARFYEQVAGLRVRKAEDDHIVLENESFRLIVHQIPERFAKNIVIAVPPQVREMSSLKLCFPVDSIPSAREAAARLGGCVYGSEREWTYGNPQPSATVGIRTAMCFSWFSQSLRTPGERRTKMRTPERVD